METYNRHGIASQVVINPETMHGDYFDNNPALYNVRVTGTYLHGILQDKAQFDIFAFVNFVPNSTGIYPAKVLTLSENATLFLWVDKNDMVHGLVVDNDDKESVEYATKCYNERKSHL
jgi:hypothetical protein